MLKINPVSLRTSLSYLKSQRDLVFKSKHREPSKWKKFVEDIYVPPQNKINQSKRELENLAPVHSKIPVLETKFQEQSSNLVCQSLAKDLRKAEKTIDSLKNDITKIQSENEKLKSKLLGYQVKRVNQICKRNKLQALSWRKKYRNLEKMKGQAACSCGNVVQENKIDHLKKNLRNAKYRAKKRRENKQNLKVAQSAETSQVAISDLLDKLSEEKAKSTVLENQVVSLQDEMKSSCYAQKLIQTRSSNVYTESIRKAIYKSLNCNVPVQKIGELIAYVVRTLTPHEIDEIPSVSTICRLVREMGVISDIHAATNLIKCADSTIGWDSTPIDGTHINQTHICTSEGSFSLGLSEMPGGKTSDYHSSIKQSLDYMSESYSEFQNMDKTNVDDSLYRNISSTIGDRVPVNHCVVNMLSETLGKDLVELNCNVHPLDGLAGTTRKLLLDNVKSVTFGKEAACVNFISAMSKMRFKNGKGDPHGFKLHLKSQKIPCKMIPRYVGNRLHILFELAGVYFCFRETLLNYLCHFCPVTNGLRTSLIKDYQNKDILEQLQVVGLFGKLLTGPWMTLAYTDSDSKVHHMSIVEPVRNCLKELNIIKGDGGNLLKRDCDIFQKPLDLDDQVLKGISIL